MKAATRLAWATALAHLVAGVLSFLYLRQASLALPLGERMAWIGARHSGWFAAWAAWAACAVTFVLYLATLSDRGRWARAAVAIGTAAAGIDLLADAIWTTAAPDLAAVGERVAFVTVERLAFVAGLVTANGLYAAAVLVASFDLKGRWPLPVALVMSAGAALLLLAGVSGSATLLQVGTPPTMIAFVAWAFLAAREAPSGQPLQEGLHRPAQAE